jgi:hypothetical protein
MAKTRTIPHWTTSAFSSALTNAEDSFPTELNEEWRLAYERTLLSESSLILRSRSVGQSASLSLNKALIRGLGPDLY